MHARCRELETIKRQKGGSRERRWLRCTRWLSGVLLSDRMYLPVVWEKIEWLHFLSELGSFLLAFFMTVLLLNKICHSEALENTLPLLLQEWWVTRRLFSQHFSFCQRGWMPSGCSEGFLKVRFFWYFAREIITLKMLHSPNHTIGFMDRYYVPCFVVFSLF